LIKTALPFWIHTPKIGGSILVRFDYPIETDHRTLSYLGHDVTGVPQLGLDRASDEESLAGTRQQKRLFVTRDRHFGRPIFLGQLGIGVFYLRILFHSTKYRS